jgi:hypothetical protein
MLLTYEQLSTLTMTEALNIIFPKGHYNIMDVSLYHLDGLCAFLIELSCSKEILIHDDRKIVIKNNNSLFTLESDTLITTEELQSGYKSETPDISKNETLNIKQALDIVFPSGYSNNILKLSCENFTKLTVALLDLFKYDAKIVNRTNSFIVYYRDGCTTMIDSLNLFTQSAELQPFSKS